MLTLPRLGRWLAPLAFAVGIAAAASQSTAAKTETAIFAGGCFWCMEDAFEKVPGVTSAVSGYTGGTVANPTYEQVGSHKTGHAEAVEVTYDPAKVTYPQLVDWYWHNIDPFDGVGQFCDKGSPYRSVIFYKGEAQKKVAEELQGGLEDEIQETDRHQDRAGRPLLSSRGLSPGLLQDEHVPVSVLQVRLRPPAASRADLGQAHATPRRHRDPLARNSSGGFLLPLGRRWSEGSDEGAFTSPSPARPNDLWPRLIVVCWSPMRMTRS